MQPLFQRTSLTALVLSLRWIWKNLGQYRGQQSRLCYCCIGAPVGTAGSRAGCVIAASGHRSVLREAEQVVIAASGHRSTLRAAEQVVLLLQRAQVGTEGSRVGCVIAATGHRSVLREAEQVVIAASGHRSVLRKAEQVVLLLHQGTGRY
ncbi:hypothetical protein NDU88_007906 [Pleurodeles waltl]|uniref:Secreted protein n=1 Tax=Pleurodeles waltl TaxID=8319 RepID=A0AAV7U0Z6_PLEWA|nr:hypothetical protein NDU88_007906 [Pleurodeles waltl]